MFGNAPVTAEDITGWLADLFLEARERGITAIEAEPEAATRWTAHLETVAGRRLLHKLKSSWYHGGNTPGKARAGSWRTRVAVRPTTSDSPRSAAAGYEGFDLAGATPRVPPGHVAGALVGVSNLERALRVYADALGFDVAGSRPLDAWVAAATGRRPGDGRMVELSADGFAAGRIWLVELPDFSPTPPGRTDRMENGRTVMVFSSWRSTG